jgi:anthranilate synthase component 2
MVLILDNEGPFTHAVAQVIGALGLTAEVRSSREVTSAAVTSLAPTHIIIASGGGHPGDAGCSVELCRTLAGRTPIFGIGLGCLALGAAFGAKIVAAAPLYGRTVEICHDSRTLYHGVDYRFRAMVCRALTVERDGLPADLEISATTPDGAVMGLRVRRTACEGVLFHPESILTLAGQRILGNFLGIR